MYYKERKTLEIKRDTTASMFKVDKNMKGHAYAVIHKIDDMLNYILVAINNKHISAVSRFL